MQKPTAPYLRRSHRLAVGIRAFYARPTLRTYRASLCVLLPAFLNRQGITFWRAQYMILPPLYRPKSGCGSKSGSLALRRARVAASGYKAALTKTILPAMASLSL